MAAEHQDYAWRHIPASMQVPLSPCAAAEHPLTSEPTHFCPQSVSRRLTLSGTAQVSSGLKTGVEISEQEVRLSSSHRTMSHNFFCEYRLDSKNPWGSPGFALFGSSSWSILGLGAGFVANPWISVSTSASLAVPLVGVGEPDWDTGALFCVANELSLEAEWLGRGP